MGARLSENELQKSLDFCVKLFDPTSPEQHERVARGVPREMMDVNSPIVHPKILAQALKLQQRPGPSRLAEGQGLPTILDEEFGQLSIAEDTRTPPRATPAVRTHDRRRSDSDAERFMVVNKINARRVVQSEYTINNFEVEEVNGLVVRLQQGNLGLMKAKKIGQ